MPPNTVSVARPTRWGNPFRVGTSALVKWWPRADDETDSLAWVTIDARLAVELYRASVLMWCTPDDIRAELSGKSLACWCKPGQPCHADVLLELANGGAL